QRYPLSTRVRSARSFKVFSKGLISIGGFCFYRPVGGFSRVKSRGAFYMTCGRDSKAKIVPPGIARITNQPQRHLRQAPRINRVEGFRPPAPDTADGKILHCST